MRRASESFKAAIVHGGNITEEKLGPLHNLLEMTANRCNFNRATLIRRCMRGSQVGRRVREDPGRNRAKGAEIAIKFHRRSLPTARPTTQPAKWKIDAPRNLKLKEDLFYTCHACSANRESGRNLVAAQTRLRKVTQSFFPKVRLPMCDAFMKSLCKKVYLKLRGNTSAA